MKIKIFFVFFLIIIFSCTQSNNEESTTTTTTTTLFNKVWKNEIPSDYKISSQWDNATVYFVITDRFYNGNTNNDTSYGREKRTDTAGHFYGGDLAGLTIKLNEGYFTDLGVDAIWITAPYEQIHGWVVGGGGKFKHYAYHGYYANDFTRLDANMGTEDELKTFIDTAHSKGIKVIFDVVMNHPGYAAIYDLNEYNVNVLKAGWENATISKYHDYIDYKSVNWVNWWGPKWIRAGLGPTPYDGEDGRYTAGGTDDLTKGLASLPDFKTESTEEVGLPAHLTRIPGTKAVEYKGFTVRDYLIKWLTDWVRNYGVDGFRCDTAKHVEKEAWYQLKVGAIYALREWKSKNKDKAIDNYDFWMTGEVFGHGVKKDDYFTIGGFNSLINFSFQSKASSALLDLSLIEETYSSYAQTINSDPSFNVLTYISSHDDNLFFSYIAGTNETKQINAGTLLLLCPGAVQIFYGDESGRKEGTYEVGTDTQQKTRSQMVFSQDADYKENIHNHWKKVGQFRRKHISIGAGAHSRIGSGSPYTFSRIKDNDKVICVLGASGSTEVDVSSVFADGTKLVDFYTGNKATVTSGKVTFNAHSNGVILIEEDK